MTNIVVVDSNLVAAIVLPLSYSDKARGFIARMKQIGAVIMGPDLWEYEFTTVLRRAQYHGLINTDQAADAIRRMRILNIRSISPSETLHQRSLEWAERLRQARAHDAQYMALAEQLDSELWTGDRRLAHSAAGLGVIWVHYVGEE